MLTNTEVPEHILHFRTEHFGIIRKALMICFNNNYIDGKNKIERIWEYTWEWNEYWWRGKLEKRVYQNEAILK